MHIDVCEVSEGAVALLVPRVCHFPEFGLLLHNPIHGCRLTLREMLFLGWPSSEPEIQKSAFAR